MKTVITGIGAYAAHNEARNPSRERRLSKHWGNYCALARVNPHRMHLPWHAKPMSRDQVRHRRTQGRKLHEEATSGEHFFGLTPERVLRAWDQWGELTGGMHIDASGAQIAEAMADINAATKILGIDFARDAEDAMVLSLWQPGASS